MRQFDYSAPQISCQYALTAIVLLLICSRSLGGLQATLGTVHRRLHLLRGLVSAPTQALNFYAFSKMPMANVYAVIFLTPFLTALLSAWFVREKVRPIQWCLIALGFVGVLIAMRPDIYGFSPPVLAVLVTALFGSIRNASVRLMGDQETPLSLALFPALAISLATFLPALTHGLMPTLIDSAFLTLGGALYAAGLLLTCLGFRYAPAATAAPFHYTQILWAMLAGMWFFGDSPDRWTMAGSLVIIGTGLALIRQQANKQSN